MNSFSVIGGSDGPTSIFIAGKLDFSWLNFFGLLIVVFMIVPNIIYALKKKNTQNLCENKTIILLEQIGRYACMFFMVVNVGILEFGFSSIGSFLLYFVGNFVLLVIYIIIWFFYLMKESKWNSMALAIIPTLIFFLSGMTLRNVLLIVSSVIFGIAHIYITHINLEDLQ